MLYFLNDIPSDGISLGIGRIRTKLSTYTLRLDGFDHTKNRTEFCRDSIVFKLHVFCRREHKVFISLGSFIEIYNESFRNYCSVGFASSSPKKNLSSIKLKSVEFSAILTLGIFLNKGY